MSNLNPKNKIPGYLETSYKYRDQKDSLNTLNQPRNLNIHTPDYGGEYEHYETIFSRSYKFVHNKTFLPWMQKIC